MENFKPAKVFDADGDLSQRWFVFYYFKNPDTGKYERFREMISASLKTRSDRYTKGKELKDAMNKRLREGFNPFSGSDPRQTNILDTIRYLEETQLTLRKRTRDTYSFGETRACDTLSRTVYPPGSHHKPSYTTYQRHKSNFHS